ncbi:hypothetical protein SOVF_169930, partial [Spinacia oleracea]
VVQAFSSPFFNPLCRRLLRSRRRRFFSSLHQLISETRHVTQPVLLLLLDPNGAASYCDKRVADWFVWLLRQRWSPFVLRCCEKEKMCRGGGRWSVDEGGLWSVGEDGRRSVSEWLPASEGVE